MHDGENFGAEQYSPVEGVGVSYEDLLPRQSFETGVPSGDVSDKVEADNLITLLKSEDIADVTETFIGITEPDVERVSPENILFFPGKEKEEVVTQSSEDVSMRPYEDDMLGGKATEAIFSQPDVVCFLDSNPKLYDFLPVLQAVSRQELESMLRVLWIMRRFIDMENEPDEKLGIFDLLIQLLQLAIFMAKDGVEVVQMAGEEFKAA